MAQSMTNVVGAGSIHDFVWSNKVWATLWARPINSSMGIDAWAMGGGFLGGHSSIRVL